MGDADPLFCAGLRDLLPHGHVLNIPQEVVFFPSGESLHLLPLFLWVFWFSCLAPALLPGSRQREHLITGAAKLSLKWVLLSPKPSSGFHLAACIAGVRAHPPRNGHAGVAARAALAGRSREPLWLCSRGAFSSLGCLRVRWAPPGSGLAGQWGSVPALAWHRVEIQYLILVGELLWLWPCRCHAGPVLLQPSPCTPLRTSPATTPAPQKTADPTGDRGRGVTPCTTARCSQHPPPSQHLPAPKAAPATLPVPILAVGAKSKPQGCSFAGLALYLFVFNFFFFFNFLIVLFSRKYKK